MFIDLTRKSPVRSVDRMIEVFVVYGWSSNCILENTTKYSTADTMVETFNTNIKYLSARGFKTVFNTMDNVEPK